MRVAVCSLVLLSAVSSADSTLPSDKALEGIWYCEEPERPYSAPKHFMTFLPDGHWLDGTPAHNHPWDGRRYRLEGARFIFIDADGERGVAFAGAADGHITLGERTCWRVDRGYDGLHLDGTFVHKYGVNIDGFGSEGKPMAAYEEHVERYRFFGDGRYEYREDVSPYDRVEKHAGRYQVMKNQLVLTDQDKSETRASFYTARGETKTLRVVFLGENEWVRE